MGDQDKVSASSSTKSSNTSQTLTTGSKGSGSGEVSSTCSFSKSYTASLSSSSKNSNSKKEKSWAVTLAYTYKKGQKYVLFMEAGKDLVDVLFGLLAIPMGGLIQLLFGSRNDLVKADGAIFRAYQSAKRLDKVKVSTPKFTNLDPPALWKFQSKLMVEDQLQQQKPQKEDQELQTTMSENNVYYSCGMIPRCTYITKELARRCPIHGRKMQMLCRFVKAVVEGVVDPKNQEENQEKSKEVLGATHGFVKDGASFYITDALEIHPVSPKLLQLMENLQLGRLGALDKLTITIHTRELGITPQNCGNNLAISIEKILKIFKASLTSATVLNDVLGDVLNDRSPPPPPSSKVSTSSCTKSSLLTTFSSCNVTHPNSSISNENSTTILLPSNNKRISSNDKDSSARATMGIDNMIASPKIVFDSDEARLAFMIDRTRPKYDDYFPRPIGYLFW